MEFRLRNREILVRSWHLLEAPPVAVVTSLITGAPVATEVARITAPVRNYFSVALMSRCMRSGEQRRMPLSIREPSPAVRYPTCRPPPLVPPLTWRSVVALPVRATPLISGAMEFPSTLRAPRSRCRSATLFSPRSGYLMHLTCRLHQPRFPVMAAPLSP